MVVVLVASGLLWCCHICASKVQREMATSPLLGCAIIFGGRGGEKENKTEVCRVTPIVLVLLQQGV